VIAVISDLHFQQTDRDVLRYRAADGTPHVIGVRRNVKAGAIDRFFEMLDDAARRHGDPEVHLVFAGDIFELHRSATWFVGDRARRRPTHDLEEHGDELHAIVLEILEGIAWECAQAFSAVAAAVTARPRLKVHYIPGNHDRLANAWPDVRSRIRELLAMDPGGEPFPVRLDFTADSDLPDHRVRVRHGQEYDSANFGRSVKNGAALDLDWTRHLAPALGDWITIDVAARLALAFRIHHAKEIRLATKKGRQLRGLYRDLTEFDDVRPSSRLVDYLVERLGASSTRVFNLLRPALLDVANAAQADPWMRERIEELGRLYGAGVAALPTLVKSLHPRVLVELVEIGTKLKERSGGRPAAMARREPGLGDTVDLVIAGHTHHPDLVPMRAGVESTLYLDSGTWRTDIRRGEGMFGRLRAYTMVFAFSEEEVAVSADDRRFATWTGHLSDGITGPFDEPAREVPSPGLPPRRLRFLRAEVHQVEKERNGAEISLRFGVDGASRTRTWKEVFRGTELRFDGRHVFDLDPALDGEVWCRGRELDWPDPDDALPWGVAYLEREEGRAFALGKGSLVMKGTNDTDFTVRFEVEEA
jgi:UDP-2,3-diacylglucosamine pyrophosphatase LpxH